MVISKKIGTTFFSLIVFIVAVVVTTYVIVGEKILSSFAEVVVTSNHPNYSLELQNEIGLKEFVLSTLQAENSHNKKISVTLVAEPQANNIISWDNGISNHISSDLKLTNEIIAINLFVVDSESGLKNVVNRNAVINSQIIQTVCNFVYETKDNVTKNSCLKSNYEEYKENFFVTVNTK